MSLRRVSREWMTAFDMWLQPVPPGPFFYNRIWTRTTGEDRRIEM
jgi:hypothetical protein